MDLRRRLLAAIDEGMSCRAAAVRFGVAPATAIRWQAQRRDTGSFAPKPQGGDRRSRRVEDRRADILAVWEERKDISLEELRQALIGVGLHVSVAGLHRFFVRRGMTRKKRLAMPSCQSARKVDPGSASNIDPPLVVLEGCRGSP
jgi:transposase